MNPDNWFVARSSSITAWLAALILCGVATLAWFGYRAADEWQRSSAQLVDRRTREIADLVVTALTRDMRAVQVSVLDSSAWDASFLNAPYDINDLVAGAFARYPYPEAFFAWQGLDHGAVFFVRTDRRPPWIAPGTGTDYFPVEVARTTSEARPLIDRIERDVLKRRPYSIFDITIGGHPYQVASRIRYKGPARDQLDGVLGFIVNLDWVRDHYFASITQQVARIAQTSNGLVCSILDDRGQTIPGLPTVARTHAATRPFPVLFFDTTITAVQPPEDLARRVWSVNVSAVGDPTLTIAARGASRTLIVVGAGALAVGLGLFITVRAARSAANTAAMRSDFVSTVTHGLKTPVSVIRGVGETLVRGRVSTPDRLREYAQLLVQESHRLTRLIENMLAYARVTDAADVYSFSARSPAEIVGEVLKGFQRILTEAGFVVSVSVPDTLPLIRADLAALVLALDNLVDNAMRYSGTQALTIEGRVAGTNVEIAVIDHGKGIPPEDLKRAHRRFAPGPSTEAHGSGLGLAIASRIANGHGGKLRVQSTLGAGTTAILSIPIFRG